MFAESKSQEGHLTIVFNTNRSLLKQRARPLLVMRMNAVLHGLHFSFVHSVSDHKGMVFAKRTCYPVVKSDIISVSNANRSFTSQK